MTTMSEETAFEPGDLFVSPDGNDQWLGNMPTRGDGEKDGPVATVAAAQRLVRTRKRQAMLQGPITVWIAGGCYALEAPLVFGPEDSAPVCYRSLPGQQAVLHGGRVLDAWTTTTVNGVSCWVTDVPETASGEWDFRQLFVNGQRAVRARLPKEGFFRMASAPAVERNGKAFHFQPAEGDVSRDWRNLEQVELISLTYWIDQHTHIESIDPDTGTVTVKDPFTHSLNDDVNAGAFARYYLENVFEALREPGDWYLDRTEGKVYYVPRQGEEPGNTEAIAPRLEQLVRFEGQPEAGAFVEFVRFEDVTFRYTLAGHFPTPGPPDEQAASLVPGALYMEGARHCALENCRIENVGGYAIEIESGSTHVRVVGNEIAACGGGGVKLNGCELDGPTCRRNSHHRVTDNHIHDCGCIFRSGVGVFCRDSSNNIIAHNHIHHLCYSGISVGWHWTFEQTATERNWIEKNHIHHLGNGLLNDMGGVYLLSRQPGTVVRGNLIHDVWAANYGGWCIYPDEGASYIVIEDNICHSTSAEAFCQHIGWENIVRNNVFAFGKQGCVIQHNGWSQDHKSFVMEGNILVTDGAPVVVGGYWGFFHLRSIISDRNVMWDIGGKPLVFQEVDHRYVPIKSFTMDEWRKDFGNDLCSVVADPKFRDMENGDYRLLPDSPALALGFRPIDMSDVGPRPRGERDKGPNVKR